MKKQQVKKTKYEKILCLAVCIVICLFMLTGADIAFAEGKSVDAAAKELANPAGSLSSLNFNLQYNEFTGDLPNSDDQDSTSLVFQPVLPFPVGDKGHNIIFRPAVPLLFDQPIYNATKADFDDLDVNLGDISFDLVYSGTTMKTKHDGFLWGIGVAGTFPSATDDAIAGDQWRLGPELFGGFVRKWGVAGALVSNQWDVGGSNDDSYCTTTANFFYAIGLGNGWQIASSPIVTYDWEADSDNALTLPVGIGLAKTTKIKGNIWKFKIDIQKYLIQPDAFGPDWLVKLTVTPVINNPFVFYR